MTIYDIKGAIIAMLYRGDFSKIKPIENRDLSNQLFDKLCKYRTMQAKLNYKYLYIKENKANSYTTDYDKLVLYNKKINSFLGYCYPKDK